MWGGSIIKGVGREYNKRCGEGSIIKGVGREYNKRCGEGSIIKEVWGGEYNKRSVGRGV